MSGTTLNVTGRVGTSFYMSPEVANGWARYDAKVDLYRYLWSHSREGSEVDPRQRHLRNELWTFLATVLKPGRKTSLHQTGSLVAATACGMALACLALHHCLQVAPQMLFGCSLLEFSTRN